MPRKKKVSVPEPRRLPSGNWFIQLRLGGRSISITEPDAATCHAKAVALKAGLIEQQTKPTNMTLRLAINNYISSRTAALSPATVRGYEAVGKYRFADIMDLPLRSITQQVLQRSVNAQAKTISPKTLKASYSFVASVIYEETGNRYRITLPKVMPRERPFLDREQLPVFLAAIRDTDIEIPCYLGLMSCRWSEIIGLRWRDVDLERGTLHICCTRVKDKNGLLVAKDATKTATSTRYIDIPSRLLTLLTEAQAQPDGFVCNMPYTTMNHKLSRVCKSCGLTVISPHGLRHTYASLGYYLGIPTKAIQEGGGWANDRILMDTYTHLSRTDARRHKNAIANFYDSAANANANANEISR